MPDIVIGQPWSTMIFVVWFVGGLCVIFAGLRLGLRYLQRRLHQRRFNEIQRRANPQELNVRFKSSEGDRFLGMSVGQVSAQLRKED